MPLPRDVGCLLPPVIEATPREGLPKVATFHFGSPFLFSPPATKRAASFRQRLEPSLLARYPHPCKQVLSVARSVAWWVSTLAFRHAARAVPAAVVVMQVLIAVCSCALA